MHLVSAYDLFVRYLASVRACELGYFDVDVHGLAVILILPNYTTIFEQDLQDEEKAEMSLCNLSKIVHIFWSSQSGKQGNKIYKATVDEFIPGYIQCTKYKCITHTDKAFAIGPTKKEFRLRTANRSGNLSYIFKAMKKIMGSSDFLVNVSQYDGEKIFWLGQTTTPSRTRRK
jgi:hypothetical protein